jgi:hypothetical protein
MMSLRVSAHVNVHVSVHGNVMIFHASVHVSVPLKMTFHVDVMICLEPLFYLL